MIRVRRACTRQGADVGGKNGSACGRIRKRSNQKTHNSPFADKRKQKTRGILIRESGNFGVSEVEKTNERQTVEREDKRMLDIKNEQK